LSVDAEHALASPRGGAGGRVLAAITLPVAALALAARSSPAPLASGRPPAAASDAYLSPATLAKHSHLVNIPLAVAALMVICNVPGSARRRTCGSTASCRPWSPCPVRRSPR
jgi:hypothetical protein